MGYYRKPISRSRSANGQLSTSLSIARIVLRRCHRRSPPLLHSWPFWDSPDSDVCRQKLDCPTPSFRVAFRPRLLRLQHLSPYWSHSLHLATAVGSSAANAGVCPSQKFAGVISRHEGSLCEFNRIATVANRPASGGREWIEYWLTEFARVVTMTSRPAIRRKILLN
jgi:hypothetical protein